MLWAVVPAKVTVPLPAKVPLLVKSPVRVAVPFTVKVAPASIVIVLNEAVLPVAIVG